MLDAKRLLIDAVCVAALAVVMFWGAESIAAVPLTLPLAAADCDKPAAEPPKQVTVAGGLPGLNLADCGDKGEKKAPGESAPHQP